MNVPGAGKAPSQGGFSQNRLKTPVGPLVSEKCPVFGSADPYRETRRLTRVEVQFGSDHAKALEPFGYPLPGVVSDNAQHRGTRAEPRQPAGRNRRAAP